MGTGNTDPALTTFDPEDGRLVPHPQATAFHRFRLLLIPNQPGSNDILFRLILETASDDFSHILTRHDERVDHVDSGKRTGMGMRGTGDD